MKHSKIRAGGKPVPRLLRLLHDRLKLRGWVALCLTVAAAASLPLVLPSRFVTQRRAALHLKRAQAHVASRQLDQARVEFRAALQLLPGSGDARRQLAAMELARGNWELAFLELESLTEMHPEDPGGWMGLADLMVAKSGLLEAPEAALDKAIEAAPQRADARLLRGEIRFRLGRYHGALMDAQAAVASAPKDAAAWKLLVRSTARSLGGGAGTEAANRAIAAVGRDAVDNLDPGPAPAPPRHLRADAQTDRGNVGAWMREHWPGRLAEMREELETQVRQKKWNEAQRIVDSARRAYPDSTFGAFMAGTFDLALGNADEAEKRFSEGMEIAPRSPTIAAALARAWSWKNGAAFAAGQLMRLAERDPHFALARYIAARAYVEARDPSQAEAALRRGLELQPDSPVPHQHLVDYYFGLDRTAEALGICQQGLDRFPRDVDLQMILAQISADLGKTDDAIRVYEDVLSRRPDLDLVQYKLAMLLASREDQAASQRSMHILRPVRNDLPSDPLLLDVLGWVHYRAHDARRARELLEAAVKGAPDEPGLHFHLGAVYVQEKKLELARAELKAALDSRRPFAERLDALRLLREALTQMSKRRMDESP